MRLKDLIEKHMLVALDLEMTGTDCEKDRIIEIGAVKIQGWEQSECGSPNHVSLTQKFSTFVHCPYPLPDEVTAFTGITNEDLEHAPDLGTALKSLKEFVEDEVLVGHNMQFNVGFLSVWGRKFGVKFENETLDTLEIAKLIYKDKIKNYSLESLAKFHGIEYNPRRTADYACITAKLLSKLALREDDFHCDFHEQPSDDDKTEVERGKKIMENKMYEFKHRVYVALDFASVSGFRDNVNRISVQSNAEEIIEVAAVKIVNGEIEGHFHSFVAIDGYDARNIEFERYRVHAYFAEAEHLIGAPSFQEVAKRLAGYVQDSVLVLRCDASFTYTDFAVFREKARSLGLLFNNATVHINELVTAAILTGAVERSGEKFERLSVIEIAQMLNQNRKKWEEVFQDYGVFFEPQSEDILHKDRDDPLSWALAMVQFFIVLKNWEIAEA